MSETPETDAVRKAKRENSNFQLSLSQDYYELCISLETRLTAANAKAAMAEELAEVLGQASCNRRQLEGEAAWLVMPEFEDKVNALLSRYRSLAAKGGETE